MNKNQRYYAFLALTNNEDFVNEVRVLRSAQSLQDNDFPKNGFSSSEAADEFILLQDKALRDGAIDSTEHPLWRIEKELILLMKKYGLDTQNDKYLVETAKHYFYLNEVVYYRDKFRLTFNRVKKEVSLILTQETTRDDIEDNLATIIKYKQKMLGKTSRKSEIFQFDQHLAFYKHYLLIKHKHSDFSDYQIIQLLFDLINKNKIKSLPASSFAGLDDQRKAYEVIRDFQKTFDKIQLLSSRDLSQKIDTD